MRRIPLGTWVSLSRAQSWVPRPAFLFSVTIPIQNDPQRPKGRRDGGQIITDVMKKYTEPMMDYCECFATEEEAIAACREVNRGLNSKDSAYCVVADALGLN
jgi:hypothetical protein